MISCDNCGAADSSCYRVKIEAPAPYQGRTLARIDLCAACAKSCFSGVFMFVGEYKKANRVGLKNQQEIT